MVIHQSRNYNEFGFITGNRVVNKLKLDSLIRDVNSGLDLLPYCPVVVTLKDDQKKIIDGQHRYETSKATNKPVYYVIADTISLQDIARLNSRSSAWKIADFLHCYSECGLKDYQEVQKLLEVFRGYFDS